MPDFYAIRGGRGHVIDVTRRKSRQDSNRAERFELTATACRIAGWSYRIETELVLTLQRNLRVLSGFRIDLAGVDRFGARLLAACSCPRGIGEVCAAVGSPIHVRPVLFHLIWKRRISVDLNRPLTQQTRVIAVEGRRTDA